MPLILWAVGVVTTAMIVKRLMREGQRVAAGLRDRHPSASNGANPETIQTLQRDPVTGIYRPV